MAKVIDWDSRIGRRVRLRDLHILFAVVQHGSMAKAGLSPTAELFLECAREVTRALAIGSEPAEKTALTGKRLNQHGLARNHARRASLRVRDTRAITRR